MIECQSMEVVSFDPGFLRTGAALLKVSDAKPG
jgi:hypothetical protein